MNKRVPLRTRFFAKKWSINPNTGCWEWTAYRNKAGYGLITAGGTKNIWLRAHRVSWLLHTGEDPGELHVCHKCDNPPCVNPNHLFLGTDAENMRDCAIKGRADRVLKLKGEECPSAKLTIDDVKAIRAAIGTHSGIADRFGVSRSTVTLIKAHKVWRHVV